MKEGIIQLLRKEKYEIVEPNTQDIKSGKHDPYIIEYIKGGFKFILNMRESVFSLIDTSDIDNPIISDISLSIRGEELIDILTTCKRDISINELFR